MTSINQINETVHSIAASNTKGTKRDGAGSFENALSRAFDTPRPDNVKSTANSLSEIFSPAPDIIKPSGINSSDIVVGKTGNLLNMLDSYSLKLKDPDVSLKSIAPVLEKIKENAGTLLKETQYLAKKDDDLKEIAAQTAAMAQTEYAKFQRGDYLS